MTFEEATELLQKAPEEVRAKLVQTWLAFSATNIVFTASGDLLLGDLVERKPESKAIPETGDTCLIGGFNGGVVAGPCSFADLADAHLTNMLGVKASECLEVSEFTHTEYPAEAMQDPLKTPFGEFNIKRVAFERIVVLSKKQMKQLTPAGKIKGVTTLNLKSFVKQYCEQSESCRFKYQLETVTESFYRVNCAGYGASLFDKTVNWFQGL